TGTAPALAQAAMKHQIDIPEQRLALSLAELAHQTQIQVIYATELVEGRSSPAVSGSMTPEEALSKVLAGTGLSYKHVDATTVTIVPPSPTEKATTQSDE